ncbi:hypothetical protein MEJ65_00820 [Candidatus Carsonella ruddii]|uniref:Uncharacterized protein n=1 Tax=Carsonella ruddii TaxID=114186 RepID=A0AAJ6K0S1_CARRU|nr:hypothetical protein [Candidatus Carsonella ruddii]WGS66613.1 hypothetical protein MEJ66_00830 [Candidatus Carsonella ruddii]WGS66810.1 hypothetical protein MEJ62_00810 [Candidatus Carsonella ruddii]WGS67002.1 hypothetical protein MEJ60_00815 [Candidatus Carsonella ruddii]WGS67193.1 hypothetical protein MEJ65_00820 [Candidatus Carsonella ruddii]WMC18210.1 MAG: hypothetical protein NU472_00830 [Candidatus Carsonella ruddii]
MEYIKKNKNITVTYLVNNKINVFIGKIKKIKKITFHMIKKNQEIFVKKTFFFKNPNLISLKINK